MKIRFGVLGLGLFFSACATSHSLQECGEDGVFFESGVAKACAYVVVRSGFRCPLALARRFDFDRGTVCSEGGSVREIPEAACDFVQARECGPTPATVALRAAPVPVNCTPVFGAPIEPTVEWTRDVRHTDDQTIAIEEDDELPVLAATVPIGGGTDSLPAGTPVVPLAIGLPEGMAFECFRVQATARYERGTVVTTPVIQTLAGNQSLPPGEYENAALAPVALDPALPEGRVSLEVSVQDISGEVGVWTRTVETVIR